MNKYLVAYKTDFQYRTVANAVGSSIASCVMGVYYLILALTSDDAVWWGALSAYAFALATVRLVLLASHKVGSKSSSKFMHEKNYIWVGVMLMILTCALSGVIVLTVGGKHMRYIGNLIYGVAFYAFFKVVMSIFNIVKAKRDNLTVLAYRSINIADALVSLVSLQAALLAEYSDEGMDSHLFNTVTGAVAGGIIIAIGIYMTVKGAKLLAARRLQ